MPIPHERPWAPYMERADGVEFYDSADRLVGTASLDVRTRKALSVGREVTFDGGPRVARIAVVRRSRNGTDRIDMDIEYRVGRDVVARAKRMR